MEAFKKLAFVAVMMVLAFLQGTGRVAPHADLPNDAHTAFTFGNSNSLADAAESASVLVSPELQRNEIAVPHNPSLQPLASTDEHEPVLTPARTSPPLPPRELSARASLVADLTNGEIYVSANPDRRWPTASIAKLMTATLAAELLPPERYIQIADSDMAVEDSAAPKIIAPGEIYTAEDLVRAMLTISSNGAAEALARAYGRDSFIAAMNGRAEAWGLHDTHFADPTGISAGSQSTARDLFRLATNVYTSHPELFQVTCAPRAALTERGTGRLLILENINLFAGRGGFVGGKTGHTDEAGGNLLSLFEIGGRTVVVIVLGTGDRFGETEKLLAWAQENLK